MMSYNMTQYVKTESSGLKIIFISFLFLFSFSFQIIFLSILKTMIRVTRSRGPTSVTSDDMVTSHKIYKKM